MLLAEEKVNKKKCFLVSYIINSVFIFFNHIVKKIRTILFLNIKGTVRNCLYQF